MTTQDTDRRGTAQRGTAQRRKAQPEMAQRGTGRFRVGSSVLREGRPDRMETTTRDWDPVGAPAAGHAPRGGGSFRDDSRRADPGRADPGRTDPGPGDSRRAS